MGFKLVSAVVMVALALSGPLAPLAWAQEKMDAQMAAAKDKGDVAWEVAAGAATAVNFVGKPILCVVGGATGVAVLLMSFGSGYRWAGRVWEEGCSGPWIITAADVKGEPTETDFWSERPDYQK